MAFEPKNMGKLFYVREDGILGKIEWTDADNPVLCNTNVSTVNDETVDHHIAYKTYTKTDAGNNVEVKGTIKINAYPNPSGDEFNIDVTGDDQINELTITISDLSGRLIHKESKSSIASNSSFHFTWQSQNNCAGFYIL